MSAWLISVEGGSIAGVNGYKCGLFIFLEALQYGRPPSLSRLKFLSKIERLAVQDKHISYYLYWN